jgi:2-polyprenyl-6-hydroxyphenyl methylase/3-demethylubiquinone-9 3-methyltransferase
MSIVYDWLDWIGGYPFEVASIDALQAYCDTKGFYVVKRKATRRLGCHELVARRTPGEAHPASVGLAH